MEYFIVFLPLLGAFIAGFFGNKFDQKYSQFMTSLFVSISSILSIIVVYYRNAGTIRVEEIENLKG